MLLTLLSLGSGAEGSEGGDMDRLEELPLCSCRMEAPQVDSTGQAASRACMATESVNGAVGLRPSLVLCCTTC